MLFILMNIYYSQWVECFTLMLRLWHTISYWITSIFELYCTHNLLIWPKYSGKHMTCNVSLMYLCHNIKVRHIYKYTYITCTLVNLSEPNHLIVITCLYWNRLLSRIPRISNIENEINVFYYTHKIPNLFMCIGFNRQV